MEQGSVLTKARRPRILRPTARWEQQPWPQHELHITSQKFYAFEARHLKRGRTPDDLYDITRRWMLRIAGVTIVLWLVVAALASSPEGREALLWVLGIVFVASLLDKFYFDFIALAAGLDSVSKDFTESRWDLICLSDASMVELIRAKHVVTQIRGWRAMLAALGLRVSVIIQVLLWLFVAPFFSSRQWHDSGIYTITFDSSSDLLAFFGVIISTFLICVAYLLEPRWRLRALAAASVRSSAFSKDATGGLMRIAGSFFRLSFAQSGAWGILLFLFAFASGFVGLLTAGNVTGILFFWLLYLIFAVWLIRATYIGFARRRLNEAFVQLVRRGGSM